MNALAIDNCPLIEDYYTLEAVAAFMGLSPKTLINRMSLGVDHPPYVGFGKAKRFPKDEFKKWTKQRMKYSAY